MLFPIVIALLVAGTVAYSYFLFKKKKKTETTHLTRPSVKPIVKKVEILPEPEEVGYESAPVVSEEKSKKARKPRAKKNA